MTIQSTPINSTNQSSSGDSWDEALLNGATSLSKVDLVSGPQPIEIKTLVTSPKRFPALATNIFPSVVATVIFVFCFALGQTAIKTSQDLESWTANWGGKLIFTLSRSSLEIASVGNSFRQTTTERSTLIVSSAEESLLLGKNLANYSLANAYQLGIQGGEFAQSFVRQVFSFVKKYLDLSTQAILDSGVWLVGILSFDWVGGVIESVLNWINWPAIQVKLFSGLDFIDRTIAWFAGRLDLLSQKIKGVSYGTKTSIVVGWEVLNTKLNEPVVIVKGIPAPRPEISLAAINAIGPNVYYWFTDWLSELWNLFVSNWQKFLGLSKLNSQNLNSALSDDNIEQASLQSTFGTTTVEELRSEIKKEVTLSLKKEISQLVAEASGGRAIVTESQGLLIVPSTGDSRRDAELKKKLEASFSDQVEIRMDQGGKTGIITPIFKNERGSDYLFVLTPVKK